MTSISPALARRYAAMGALAVIAAILLLDRPVASWAHALHRPAWCLWLTWIADVPAPAAVLGLAVSGAAWLATWRLGMAGGRLLAVCIATLTADAAKDVLKFAFGRPWPETWVNNNPSWIATHTFGFFPFHGGPGWASFPSGHMTVIAAPCVALWPYLPQWRPILVLVPSLVAVGLIGCDFHFLSDCLAGALLGAACALAAVPALAPDGAPDARSRPAGHMPSE